MFVYGRLLLPDERDRACVAQAMQCLGKHYPQQPMYDESVVGSTSIPAAASQPDDTAPPVVEPNKGTHGSVLDLRDDAELDGVKYTVCSITDLHYTLRVAHCSGAFSFGIIQDLRRLLGIALVDVVLRCDSTTLQGPDDASAAYTIDLIVLHEVARVAAENVSRTERDASFNPHFSARVHRELARMQSWNPRDDDPRRGAGQRPSKGGGFLALLGLGDGHAQSSTTSDAMSSTDESTDAAVSATDHKSHRSLFEPLNEQDAQLIAGGDLRASSFEAVCRYLASQSYAHQHSYHHLLRPEKDTAGGIVALNTVAPKMRLLGEFVHGEEEGSAPRADDSESEPRPQAALVTGYTVLRASTLIAMMRSPLFNRRVTVTRITPRVLAVTHRFPRIFLSLLDRTDYVGALSVHMELRAPVYKPIRARRPAGMAVDRFYTPGSATPTRPPSILGKRDAAEMEETVQRVAVGDASKRVCL